MRFPFRTPPAISGFFLTKLRAALSIFCVKNSVPLSM